MLGRARARLENAALVPRTALAKQAAHAISNTRAPASSALRLPLPLLAPLALLLLPARAARAEAAAAAGPAMLYQPGRQAQAEHCCLVTDFDGLCSDHESSTVSVVSAEFLRSGSRVLKAQQR